MMQVACGQKVASRWTYAIFGNEIEGVCSGLKSSVLAHTYDLDTFMFIIAIQSM